MKRHTCSYCSKKRYANKMVHIYYYLLHRSAWHCYECWDKIVLSSADDIAPGTKRLA